MALEDIYGRKKETSSKEFLIGVMLAASILVIILGLAIANSITNKPTLNTNNIMWMVLVIAIQFLVRLYLVYWVIKDSIERGMSSPPGWGLFVVFYPIIGMIFYYIFRTDGDSVECKKCGQRMSEILHECPRCKYRKEIVKKRSWRKNNG